MSNGQTEGPLGLPMKDEVARLVDGLLKSLDADCRSFLEKQTGGIARRAKAPASVDLKPGERADISIINTATLDLDREVVLPAGGDWSYFAKNGGRVTWCHDYALPDVGRNLWMVRSSSPDGWKAKTCYHERPPLDVLPESQPWFPDVVNYYVQELGLKGKSIGFVPTEIRRPTAADIKARPELEQANYIIGKWVGLEYAVAPIQCNPDAVVDMVSKARAKGLQPPAAMATGFGVVVPEWGGAGKGHGTQPPPAVQDKVLSAHQVREIVRKRVAAINIGQMVADALDARRGRV